MRLFQTVIVLFLLSTIAWAQSPEAARAELQRRGLKYENIPFLDTIIKGDTELVKLYLDAGMSPMTANAKGKYALWYAAINGRLEIVRLLLARGADVNSVDPEKDTPLSGGVISGSLAVVKTLLDSGANINASGNDWGSPPLTIAISTNSTVMKDRTGEEKTVVRYLLERGADPTVANDKGVTPLVLAAGLPDAEIAGALLERGADVNAKDEVGDTPLLEAVRFACDKETRQPVPGALDVVRLLLAHGADTSVRNHDGETALKLAKGHRSEALVMTLLESKLRVNLFTRIGYLGYRFNRAQSWFGPAVYLIAVVVALIGLRKPVMPERQEVESGDGLPRLAPLKCRQCAAPVPIVPDKLACPNCGAPVEVPEDYSETLSLRSKTAANYRRAEREWRKALRYSMPLVTNLLLLISTAWLLTWLLGLFSPFTMTRPWWPFISTMLSGVTISAGLFFYTFYLISAHRLLPPLPVIGKEVAAEEMTGCRQCGAVMAFAAGQLVTGCAYCGSETYRLALARQARKVAAEEEVSTAVSVYDAVVELEERRKGVFIWVAVIGTVLLLGILATIAITAVLVVAAALLLLYLYLMFS